jgi:hypothetical protein
VKPDAVFKNNVAKFSNPSNNVRTAETRHSGMDAAPTYEVSIWEGQIVRPTRVRKSGLNCIYTSKEAGVQYP